MNRRVLIVVGVLVVVILGAVGAVALLSPASTPDAAPTTPASVETDEPDDPMPTESADADDAIAPSPGVFAGYSEEAVAQGEGRILLFFHAPWCPQCRSIESDITAQGVPDGVTILLVDYDSRQDLRQQYGVTLQTTFVEVDTDGDAVQTHVAYDDPHLDAVISAMI